MTMVYTCHTRTHTHTPDGGGTNDLLPRPRWGRGGQRISSLMKCCILSWAILPAGLSSQLGYPPSWAILPAGLSSQLGYPPSWATLPAGLSSQLGYPPSWAILPAGLSSQLGYPPSWATLPAGLPSQLGYPPSFWTYMNRFTVWLCLMFRYMNMLVVPLYPPRILMLYSKR